MKISRPIRQGDVFVAKISRAPRVQAKEAAIERAALTLALGEATGHHHTLYGAAGDTLTRQEDVIADLNTALRKAGILMDDWSVDAHVNISSASVPLNHQEHGTITHEKGDYVVIRQREYAPGEVRRVAD